MAEKNRKKSGDMKKMETASETAASGGEDLVDAETLQARARDRDELVDLLQRERAEFSNYRKRIERDRVAWANRAVADFVMKLLPVLDDFDRALAHVEESTDLVSFAEGIRLIESKIYDVLKSNDVQPFEPAGERFDPAEHEAVIVENTDDVPDGTVSEVLLKGYRQNDRVLRAAKVKVARNTSSDEIGTGEEETTNDADV